MNRTRQSWVATSVIVLLATQRGCAVGSETPDVLDVGVETSVDAGPRTDVRSEETAPMIVGDAAPRDSIAFFRASTCPTGWALYLDGVGRTLVPLVDNGTLGGGAGTPLSSQQIPSHTHMASTTIMPDAVSYAGIAGGGNTGVGAATSVEVMLQADTAPGALPYSQWMVCRKAMDAPSGIAPMPTGSGLFFARAMCPTGWSKHAEWQGRMIVGTPLNGTQGATFGGMPLTNMEDRQHTHTIGGTLGTRAHGIALAAGCCAGGYAQQLGYSYTATTSGASVGMPYVQLQFCTKD